MSQEKETIPTRPPLVLPRYHKLCHFDFVVPMFPQRPNRHGKRARRPDKLIPRQPRFFPGPFAAELLSPFVLPPATPKILRLGETPDEIGRAGAGTSTRRWRIGLGLVHSWRGYLRRWSSRRPPLRTGRAQIGVLMGLAV
jgi:hypothetical protein